MTEVDTANMDAAPEAPPFRSCDLSSPSLPPCQPLCTNQEEEDRGCLDDRKLEQQKQCKQGQPKKKIKTRRKLERGITIDEESFPPTAGEINDHMVAVEDEALPCSHDDQVTSCKEEGQQKNEEPKNPSLSKEPSQEYTDSTGIDLHRFIVDTLNSNPRDRIMVLKLEQDMVDFIMSNSPFKKFPHMSSYHRMLVHRVAAYFGMEHNVDQTGKAVIINKTSNTRLPEQRFLDYIHVEKVEEIQQWKAILKRDNNPDEQPRLHPLRERKSRSMEEREEEYQRVRERIFNQEPVVVSENPYTSNRAEEEGKLSSAMTQRRRELFRRSRDSSGSSRTGSSKHSSTDTEYRYGNDPPPWSSTESESSYQWTSSAPKAHHSSNHSWDTRGAGTISLYRLPSVCPCAPSPPILQEPAAVSNPTYIMENGILMNTHTGQPFLNHDGTSDVYNPTDGLQPIRGKTQPPVPPPQQPQQVVQYPSSSYHPPHALPLAPSQPYSTVGDLPSQFAHMTVSCQSTAEAPPIYPPTQGYVYTAPPPPNPPSYCQPPPQVPVLYYCSQFPTSAPQICRPPSPAQHAHCQPAASTGYHPAMAMQSCPNQSQALLGSYSSLTNHQHSMVQGGVSVPYAQGAVMSAVGGEGGYCCMVAPPCSQGSVGPPPPLHGTCNSAGCATQSWGMQY